jgi:hypothetical protein
VTTTCSSGSFTTIPLSEPRYLERAALAQTTGDLAIVAAAQTQREPGVPVCLVCSTRTRMRATSRAVDAGCRVTTRTRRRSGRTIVFEKPQGCVPRVLNSVATAVSAGGWTPIAQPPPNAHSLTGPEGPGYT